MRDTDDWASTARQIWAPRAKLEALIEHIPAIVYESLWGADVRSTYVSPQIEPILGVTRHEWTADPDLWQRLLHREDCERAVATYRGAIEAGKPGAHEYRMVRRDERVVWIRDEFTVVRNLTDNSALVQGVMFDVTQQKETERQLRTAEARTMPS